MVSRARDSLAEVAPEVLVSALHEAAAESPKHFIIHMFDIIVIIQFVLSI